MPRVVPTNWSRGSTLATARKRFRISSLLLLLTTLLQILHSTTAFQSRVSIVSTDNNLPRVASIRRQQLLLATATSSSTTSTKSKTESQLPQRQTVGSWEYLHGNFLLRPSIQSGPPRALLHFLGGALVGASPHITYRYFLERLADNGYLIVATPYDLSFDHLQTCDSILTNFERIAGDLARTYGALPVVGIGHSCGALLQLLITSLFPDTPRAANAMISYNNKPIQEAVPFFDGVFAPLFANANQTSDAMRVGLDLLRAATLGELPSDDLLQQACALFVPPTTNNMASPSHVQVPPELREAFASLTGPATAALTEAGLAPLASETLYSLQQIPLLITEVANGARDFNPSPTRVRAVARRAYRARRTLLVQYADDRAIDETDDLQELLVAAAQVIRNKRPMVTIDLQKEQLAGGHAAPLLAPPLAVAQRAETLLGTEQAKELYLAADQTVNLLVRWLGESNL
jgi:hypothetical protein